MRKKSQDFIFSITLLSCKVFQLLRVGDFLFATKLYWINFFSDASSLDNWSSLSSIFDVSSVSAVSSTSNVCKFQDLSSFFLDPRFCQHVEDSLLRLDQIGWNLFLAGGADLRVLKVEIIVFKLYCLEFEEINIHLVFNVNKKLQNKEIS